MLREFVDTELVQGKLENGIHFDDAFNNWKLNRLTIEVDNISEKSGLNSEWLLRSVNAFVITRPTTIPYIDEITKSVNYEKASDEAAGNKLKDIMTMTRLLPGSIMELKLKYE